VSRLGGDCFFGVEWVWGSVVLKLRCYHTQGSLPLKSFWFHLFAL
jgi:hypothetical protein